MERTNRLVLAAGAACALVLSPIANAKNEPKAAEKAAPAFKSETRDMNVSTPPVLEYSLMTDEQFRSAKAAARERSQRDVAGQATGDWEPLLSRELKDFRRDFLRVTDAAGLEQLLKRFEGATPAETQAKFNALPEDLKLVVLQMELIKPYKGIAWRMKDLFVNAEARLAHSFVLTAFRQMVTGAKTYLPTPQWNAFLQYTTVPMDGVRPQIVDSNGLHRYIESELYPAFQLAATRLHALKTETDIIVDNQLFYGSASFQDGIDRYKKYGSAERNAHQAALEGTLASISAASAYWLTNGLAVSQSLASMYGLDAILPWSEIDGAPACGRAAKIRDGGPFLTLRSKEWMARSFFHLSGAVSWGSLAWNETRRRGVSPNGLSPMILNPALGLGVNQQVSLSFDKLEEMIKGRTTVVSAVTGERISIDLPQFFRKPPEDLKVFLPKDCEGGRKTGTKTITAADGKRQSVEYRNYFEGRPNTWELDHLKPYFPDLRQQNQVPVAARILSQVWGGGVAAAPLSFIVQ